MPEQRTIERARRDKRQGKSASTQAGEFVREEIEHIREGRHGARSAKQAIAIGLSKARRAGVDLPAPSHGSARTKRQAKRESARAGEPVSRTRSRAAEHALEREPRRAVSHEALSRQARSAAKQRTHAERSAAARRGARTRAKRAGRS
jgi:hypothetical protein